MDPLVVFDCQKLIPNKFALALVAAARHRALAWGAEPRLAAAKKSLSELALYEIAQGCFTPDELAPFLIHSGETMPLSSPGPIPQLRGGGDTAAATVPTPKEMVH